MTEAEKKVRERWPDARAGKCLCGAFHISQGYPRMTPSGLYLIHSGTGLTEEAAWQDAAKRLEAQH